jgi:hypothetical protein
MDGLRMRRHWIALLAYTKKRRRSHAPEAYRSVSVRYLEKERKCNAL